MTPAGVASAIVDTADVKTPSEPTIFCRKQTKSQRDWALEARNRVILQACRENIPGAGHASILGLRFLYVLIAERA